jgi:hypothetical protein
VLLSTNLFRSPQCPLKSLDLSNHLQLENPPQPFAASGRRSTVPSPESFGKGPNLRSLAAFVNEFEPVEELSKSPGTLHEIEQLNRHRIDVPSLNIRKRQYYLSNLLTEVFDPRDSFTLRIVTVVFDLPELLPKPPPAPYFDGFT